MARRKYVTTVIWFSLRWGLRLDWTALPNDATWDQATGGPHHWTVWKSSPFYCMTVRQHEHHESPQLKTTHPLWSENSEIKLLYEKRVEGEYDMQGLLFSLNEEKRCRKRELFFPTCFFPLSGTQLASSMNIICSLIWLAHPTAKMQAPHLDHWIDSSTMQA